MEKKFGKKLEPAKAESIESGFKSLMERIKTKIDRPHRELKTEPRPHLKEKLTNNDVDLSKYRKKVPSSTISAVNESRARTANRSLLTRVSQGEFTHTSGLGAAANSQSGIAMRDRSNMKERISRLSTMERLLKNQNTLKQKIMKKEDFQTAHPKASLAQSPIFLMQQYKIHQIKENSASSGSNKKSRAQTAGRLRENIDLLKKRIESQQAKPNGSPEASDQGPSNGAKLKGQINSVSTSQGIDLGAYKKKVIPMSYKRDNQSSLKILRERRGAASSGRKKNVTLTHVHNLNREFRKLPPTGEKPSQEK